MNLKCCPFCSGEVGMIGPRFPYRPWARVGCAGCGTLGPVRETPEAAAEAWNHRPEEAGRG